MLLRRVYVVSVFLIMCVASLFMAQNVFALSACSCSCVDSNTTERLMTAPPAAGQTFAQKCQADQKCGDRPLASAYSITVTVSGVEQTRTACECVTPQISTTLVKQAAGDTTCAGTCEASCRGQGFALNTAVAPTVVQTGCITDADCKTGIFKEFKGVTCVTTGSGSTATRTCNIPITGELGAANADIECSKFGGKDMQGSTCDFLDAADSPQSYLVTRPYLRSTNGVLSYSQRVYNTSVSTYSIQTLWQELDRDGSLATPPSTFPGICYLLGSQEADYTSMDVTKTIVSGSTKSKRYACVKRKISQCGTVSFSGYLKSSLTPIIKNGLRYSCMSTSGVPEAQRTSNCFSPSGSYPSDSGTTVRGSDLCAAPNQLCCALSCSLDSECGPYKICSNGQCIMRTECNPNDSTWRCRAPTSPAEANNSSMCLPTLVNSLCQNSSHRCCAPINQNAIGSCAADMQNNQEFINRYPNNGWQNFACLTAKELDAAGQQLISDWKSGGDCIIADVAASSGELKAVSRCGQTKRCCLVSSVAPAKTTQLATRPALNSGSTCSGNLEFANSCIDLYQILAPMVDTPTSGGGTAGARGSQSAIYDSVYALANEVIASGVCEATPLVPGNPFNTYECAASSVCCYRNLHACDPSAASPCTTGSTCHKTLKLCVPDALVQKQLSSDNCRDRASEAGDSSVEFIQSLNTDVDASAYTCQIVKSSDTAAASKCFLKGCTAPDGQTLGDGEEFRCCIPGVGKSPAASAVTSGLNSSGGAKSATTPGTIGLSSCISSGDCQLSDILITAANFANFLFKISGAVFLAIFVYAGFEYLTAGVFHREKQAMKRIKEASIGLILLFGGYVLINFIQSSFISSAYNQAPDKCGTTAETANMSCQILEVDANDSKGISELRSKRGCVERMCNGAKNRLCCPSVKTTVE